MGRIDPNVLHNREVFKNCVRSSTSLEPLNTDYRLAWEGRETRIAGMKTNILGVKKDPKEFNEIITLYIHALNERKYLENSVALKESTNKVQTDITTR